VHHRSIPAAIPRGDRQPAETLEQPMGRANGLKEILGGLTRERGDARLRSASGFEEGALRGGRLGDALRSVGVGLLLFLVVGAAIAGAEVALFFTVLTAWLLFPVLGGIRSTLDAGCAFMLISIGVLVVVGLAQNGPGSLMP
jgi:hypothetical protein